MCTIRSLSTCSISRISREKLKAENTIRFELVIENEFQGNGKNRIALCGTDNSYKPQLIHTMWKFCRTLSVPVSVSESVPRNSFSNSFSRFS